VWRISRHRRGEEEILEVCVRIKQRLPSGAAGCSSSPVHLPLQSHSSAQLYKTALPFCASQFLYDEHLSLAYKTALPFGATGCSSWSLQKDVVQRSINTHPLVGGQMLPLPVDMESGMRRQSSISSRAPPLQIRASLPPDLVEEGK